MAGLKQKTLSEENLTSILGQLNITLSALRDAICDSGVDATTLKDVKDAIDSLETLSAEVTKWGGTVLTGRDISLDLKALTDDGIKGILKSLGDIGAGSNIATLLDDIKTATEKIDDLQGALKSVDSDELITRITDSAGTEINPAKEDGNLSTVNTNIANLTKTEDTAHSSGDKGIMLLGVRKDDVAQLAGDDGDYNPVIVNEDGILRAQAQQHLHIDELSTVTGWTVLGNDTANLATTTNHVVGTLALKFDKVDGADNTVFAGAQKTLSGLPDFNAYLKGNGFFLWSIYLSSITDVDYIFLRLGTNSSHYNEWRISGDDLGTGWSALRMPALSPDAVVGNGWDSASVTYIVIGVAFDAQDDTLADITVDHLALNTGLQTSADITAEITSAVASPNVKVQKWRNYNVDLGAGSVGNGTLRTTLASDDPAVATLGATDEAAASAGGTGSVSAKLRHVSGRAGTTGEAASTSGSEAAQARSIGVAVESLDTKEGTTGAVAAADGTRAAQLRAIADDLDSLDTKEGTTGEAASVSGTRAAQLRAIGTALEIIDDWDETNRAKVNPIVGQAGVAAGAGAVGVTVPRTTLASDDPAVASLAALRTLASSVATTPTQIIKTVAAIATPEALAADGTYFRTATLVGIKAARTDNVGVIYLGIGAANDTQFYSISPGQKIELEAPPGEKYDLNDWYLDVLNAGDGVGIIYS